MHTHTHAHDAPTTTINYMGSMQTASGARDSLLLCESADDTFISVSSSGRHDGGRGTTVCGCV
jgi:hypothetical protein